MLRRYFTGLVFNFYCSFNRLRKLKIHLNDNNYDNAFTVTSQPTGVPETQDTPCRRPMAPMRLTIQELDPETTTYTHYI